MKNYLWDEDLLVSDQDNKKINDINKWIKEVLLLDGWSALEHIIMLYVRSFPLVKLDDNRLKITLYHHSNSFHLISALKKIAYDVNVNIEEKESNSKLELWFYEN